MFKIFLSRDIFADTPEKRKKITGIHVMCGYHCYISCSCDCGHKCKYRKNFRKFHNMNAAIYRFFEYRLHIKLPPLFYISKESNDMSGTTMCPFKKPRRHTCHDCTFCAGVDMDCDTICYNKDRHQLRIENRWREAHIDDETRANCTFFNKVSWADDYDKKTGSVIPSKKNKKNKKEKK